MFDRMISARGGRLLALALLCVALLWSGITPLAAQGRTGAVYVLTNQSSGNGVNVYMRATDGSLTFNGAFPTGGTGLGTGADPLGSQGSLVLGGAQRLLFAANAGSNSVTVFAVTGLRLHLLNTVASGGQMPVSIAVSGRLVYVLNAGGTPNISGFRIDFTTNRLVPLPGSTVNLPGGSAAAPAEVSFSKDGAVLMVTEKGTNKIDTFIVNRRGDAVNPITTDSSGATPFGFAFVQDFAIVSEAGPSALSSYEVGNNGDVNLITGSLGDTQLANCWVVIAGAGRFAYTSNSASASISSYTISRDGALSLLNPTAVLLSAGSAPVDMALTPGGRFLYVRDGVNNEVDGFRVGTNGSLAPLGAVDGLPAGSQGIAAR